MTGAGCEDLDDAAISARLELGVQVVRWCVRRAERAERRGHSEEAAQWAMIAAEVAWRTPYPYLCSIEIEALLARLSRPLAQVRRRRSGGVPRRWLHVLSASWAIGGHTALVRRWIERNPHGDRHDVVLTFQAVDQIEPRLRAAVERSGGRAMSVASADGVFSSAQRLREAAADADVVVLNIHPWNVIGLLAFAQPGGPPVLLLNHQDHAFWAGSGTVDLVIDIRTSGRYLTENFRAVPGCVELPMPLVDDGVAPADRAGVMDRLRFTAGVGDGPLLVTIGRGEKYIPTSRLDFLRAAEEILRALPEARLVAVGPHPNDPAWQMLAARTGGRALAVGEDQDLRHWHSAADLYLEGFPIGSYTALLETALAARAVVRKPHLVSPDVLPLDQGALGPIEVPASPADYVRAAVDLASDAESRRVRAQANRESVLVYHCGAAWDQRLTEIRDQLPREHHPVVGSSVRPLPFELAAYWTRYRIASGQPDAFMMAFLAALTRGLRPRVDASLFRGLSEARAAGALPIRPGKALLGSWGLSLVPSGMAERLYWAAP